MPTYDGRAKILSNPPQKLVDLLPVASETAYGWQQADGEDDGLYWGSANDDGTYRVYRIMPPDKEGNYQVFSTWEAVVADFIQWRLLQ